MPYSSKEDISKKIPFEFLVAISDLNEDGSLDSDVIDAAIEEVDAEIDGRLEKEYSVPFATPAPTVIKWISAWCAIGKMARSRGISMEAGWEEEINRKKEELERYAEGDDIIPGLSSRREGSPSRLHSDALPCFTQTKRDINGQAVNTDEVGDAGGQGTFDVV